MAVVDLTTQRKPRRAHLARERAQKLCPTCGRKVLSAAERDHYHQCEECAENEARSFWAI